MQVGCGPALVLTAFASRKVRNVIMTDYNPKCLQFIDNYIMENDFGHVIDWSPHFSQISSIEMEGNAQSVSHRILRCVKFSMKIDLRSSELFEAPIFMKFDIIYSSLCLQVAAKSPEEYKGMIKKLKNYINPKGWLFQIAVIEQTFYMSGKQMILTVPMTSETFTEALK